MKSLFADIMHIDSSVCRLSDMSFDFDMNAYFLNLF